MAFSGQSFSVGQVLTAAQMNTMDGNIDTVRIHHKGSSQPAELAAGVTWLDDSSTPWVLKIYDGAAFINLMNIDPSGDTFSFDDITVDDITVSSIDPQIFLHETDQAADEKRWEVGHVSGAFRIATRTDAGVLGESGFELLRTGTTVDKAQFPNGSVIVVNKMKVGENSTPSEALDVVGNVLLDGLDQRLDIGDGTDAQTLFDLNFPDVSTGNALARVFRNTNTSGTRSFRVHRGDASSTIDHEFRGGEGASIGQPTGGVPGTGVINAEGYQLNGTDLKQKMAGFWINFNGTGTISTRDSFNVSSITDNGTGDYTITIDSNFSNANWSPYGICAFERVQLTSNTALTAGDIDIEVESDSGSNTDVALISVGGFGDH